MSSRGIVAVYGPAKPRLAHQFRELIAKRELLLAFAERDLRIRYKQTLLGVVWAVVPPFMLMVVFSVFFGKFARVSSEGLPYPVFVYAGLLPWNYFSAVVTGATASLAANQAIISKVAFPREILPLFHILSSGVDFLVASAIFAFMLVYYGISVSWTVLYALPLLLIEVVLMAAVGLLFAIANTYYRDVRYIVPLLLQVLMFSSPVVYSVRSVPDWARPYYLILNPIAGIIDSYRGAILRRTAPDLGLLALIAVLVCLLFLASYRIFKYAERNVADVV
jgi:lipopolysaccharide transport system permease protein